MSKFTDKQLLVGLDIGTSKVTVIVCEVSPDSTMEVVGIGQHDVEGMRKGMVSNIEQTVSSICNAIKEAEMMAGCEIAGVFAGITGAHIRSYNSTGVVSIRNDEITVSDVEHVIDAARAISISTDERILHVLPQSFRVDNQDGIYDPVGMCGMRLEADVHIITGNSSAVQNVLKCIRMCNLEVEEVILGQIAAGHAVLSEDEKELGVCLVDIGEGTTDLAVYYDGAVRYSTVIPIAGSQVTKDIAITLRTPTIAAEKIKHRYGCAHVPLIDREQTFELPGIGDQPSRKLSRKQLAEVMEPRVEELLEYIYKELDQTEYLKIIGSGFVLTGGSSKMEGIVPLAEKVFEMPVRLGMPAYSATLSEIVRHPKFSTSVGLCEFGYSNRSLRRTQPIAESAPPKQNDSIGIMERLRQLFQKKDADSVESPAMFGRMKSWFQGEF